MRMSFVEPPGDGAPSGPSPLCQDGTTAVTVVSTNISDLISLAFAVVRDG
jgi:hypothetical protein